MTYQKMDGWRYLLRGFCCLQIALFFFLASPGLAFLGWQANWQAKWSLALTASGLALGFDFAGRALVWVSEIGSRNRIITSFTAQAAGWVAAAFFFCLIPDYGLPIGLVLGLTVALAFQTLAVISFTEYLADLCRRVGDDIAMKMTGRLRFEFIVAVCMGGVSFFIAALMWLIPPVHFFMLAMVVLLPFFIIVTVPHVIYVLAASWHYVRILVLLKRTIGLLCSVQNR